MTKNLPQNGSVFRVHKTGNYTIMSNTHLTDKTLSLKAKGLLSVMLSLPPEWNYSINGLVALSSDGRDGVLNTLKALQDSGYLFIDKERNARGQYNAIYNIYEEPRLTESDFPNRLGRVGIDESENPIQLNTNNEILKTNTKSKEKKEKETFGVFENVFLTKEHIEKLRGIYKTEENVLKAINILSTYKETNNKKYKNDYAVLNEFNWVYPKIFPANSKKQTAKNNNEVEKNNSDIPNYESVSRW